jgi:hypothetical protein
VRGKVQTSTFVDGGGKLHGMAHDMIGQNGCGALQDVKYSCRVDRA